MCLTAFGKHLQLLPLPYLITLGYLSLQVMITYLQQSDLEDTAFCFEGKLDSRSDRTSVRYNSTRGGRNSCCRCPDKGVGQSSFADYA